MDRVEKQTEQTSISYGLDILKGIMGLFGMTVIVIFVVGLSGKSSGLAVLFVGGVGCYFLLQIVKVLEKILEALKELQVKDE